VRAGLGGALNVYELQKHNRRPASPVRMGVPLASGENAPPRWQVLNPDQQHIRTPDLGPLASDVASPDGVIPAPTRSATLITPTSTSAISRHSPVSRTKDRLYRVKNGPSPASPRQSYAPYSDLIGWRRPPTWSWQKFAEGVKSEFPDQMLAINCSPSSTGSAPDDRDHREVPERARRDGFNSSSSPCRLPRAEYSMFDLAHATPNQMSAYVDCRSAIRRRGAWLHCDEHQRELAQATSTGSPPPGPPKARHRLAGSTERAVPLVTNREQT